MRPVTATYLGQDEYESTGIGWDDYSRMHTQAHAIAPGRREVAPEWVFSDVKLRDVILLCIEARAFQWAKKKHAAAVREMGLTHVQRLALAQKALAERRPQLEDVINCLCADYVAAKKANDAARVRFLQPKIEECDTALRMIDDPAKFYVGVAYFYWRVGLDSVATGQRLGLKPPHVRQICLRMKACAGQLGYGPVVTIKHKPGTMARRRARKKAQSEPAKARRFYRYLCSGLTWDEAKSKMGDKNPHNHYWRALCLKCGLVPPKRHGGSRVPDVTPQQARQAAGLRKEGMAYDAIAARLGVGMHAMMEALKRARLYELSAVGEKIKAGRGKVDVAEAKLLRAQGWSWRTIAEKFGVDHNAIRHHLRKNTASPNR